MRVARADAGEVVQRHAGESREEALEHRPADLLAATGVARGGGHHHASLDQPGELVDLL